MSNFSYDCSSNVSTSSLDKTDIKRSLYEIQYSLSCLLSCDELSWKLNSTIQYVYKPLEYAKENYLQFLSKFINSSKKLMFLGMNPGPWGMVQTGVRTVFPVYIMAFEDTYMMPCHTEYCLFKVYIPHLDTSLFSILCHMRSLDKVL